MKISVDDKELFSLSDIQKSVIKDYVHEDIFDADMCRRLCWVLTHLYDQAFKRLKDEWELKLRDRVESVPTHPDRLAELIMSQPDYKCRKTRDAENALNPLI